MADFLIFWHLLGHRFPRGQYPGYGLPHRDYIAFIGEYPTQGTGCWRFDLDRGFIGLNLHNRFPLGNRLSISLKPGKECAGILAHPQSWHDNFGGQGYSPEALTTVFSPRVEYHQFFTRPFGDNLVPVLGDDDL